MGHRFIYNNHIPPAVSSIVDPDGNVYTEVVIGSQTWLKEPLRATKTWSGNTVSSGDPSGNTANWNTYGKLYPWYSLTGTSTESICPVGYHVATTAEWDKLLSGFTFTSSQYVGAGTALKAVGTTLWKDSGGTDDRGFTQGGAGYFIGGGYDYFRRGNWTWTSTSISAGKAQDYEFNSDTTHPNKADVGKPATGQNKTYPFGFVRVIKD